jgi:hypothetical protein
VPPVAVQVTAELYAPVPVTVAAQVDVCDAVIDVGDAATVILVMVGAAETVTAAEPEMLV